MIDIVNGTPATAVDVDAEIVTATGEPACAADGAIAIPMKPTRSKHFLNI